MNKKERIIGVGVALLLFLALLQLVVVEKAALRTALTGSATQTSSGEVALCLDGPPSITAIADQSATVDQAFSLQVSASDNDDSSLSYRDDTALFAIDTNGAISFTPASADTGTHSITITVEDDVGCLGFNSTDTFVLTISAAGGGGGGGSGGGGGGGGGGGAAAGAATGEVVTHLTSEEFQEASISVGGTFGFTYAGSHSLQVTEVGKNYATVLVSSQPQKVTLFVGEAKKVDLDSDTLLDLEVKLLSTEGKKANFALKLLRKGFKVSQDFLKVRVRQSQTLEKKIFLTNDWGGDLQVFVTSPQQILVAPETALLPRGGEVALTLLMNPYQALPEVYPGLITVVGRDSESSFTKLITTLIEIVSDDVLLDLSLDLRTKALFPEGTLEAVVSLFNPRNVPLEDLTLWYSIQDMQGQRFFQEEEKLALQEQVSFTKRIILPPELLPGEYTLSIKAVYDTQVATAAEIFTLQVPEKKEALVGFAATFGEKPFSFLTGALLVLFLAALFLGFFLFRRKVPSSPRIIKQIIVKHIRPKRPSVDHSVLRRKLSLVEEGYQKGFIGLEAYQKTKAKIDSLLKR